MRALIEEQRNEGVRLPDGDVAAAARCVETGAREARNALGGGDGAYVALVDRLLKAPEKRSPDEAPLIVAP